MASVFIFNKRIPSFVFRYAYIIISIIHFIAALAYTEIFSCLHFVNDKHTNPNVPFQTHNFSGKARWSFSPKSWCPGPSRLHARSLTAWPVSSFVWRIEGVARQCTRNEAAVTHFSHKTGKISRGLSENSLWFDTTGVRTAYDPNASLERAQTRDSLPFAKFVNRSTPKRRLRENIDSSGNHRNVGSFSVLDAALRAATALRVPSGETGNWNLTQELWTSSGTCELVSCSGDFWGYISNRWPFWMSFRLLSAPLSQWHSCWRQPCTSRAVGV
jgi:hypothetical protein